ncbi:STAS domain-containing protein [Pontibacillus sp. HMF3514]|uniref:STAS domain-containing protein n=1 Tax=Pontibacillus sp. HMF3514 TaxID=2692425 RepID=UPI00131FE0C3|nr:STAS domain-containing protein [Pontibacillus sp. HMF3514]QHE53551.1 RsbR, positive regulator of sigma-B [Pontibacillus sp. HMF3514]
MESIGKLPSNLYSTKILEAIGENIIIADEDFNITWINPSAKDLFENIITLYNLENVDDLIGMNMDHFHKDPAHQRNIMNHLTDTHRTRINIKDTYVTDIIVNPIMDNGAPIGYVVMLMDVTTKVQEERRKEKLIEELSVPILHVWDYTLAITLKGTIDDDRFQTILSKLLEKCHHTDVEYVILDLSGVTGWNEEFPAQITKVIENLSIMGAHSIIAGVKPELALDFALETSYNVPKFKTSKEAIKYIIARH